MHHFGHENLGYLCNIHSVWQIADNDAQEVCQTGRLITGLPSPVGRRSGCVHLANELSHREDEATRVTK